jgi:hypothetical protein
MSTLIQSRIANIKLSEAASVETHRHVDPCRIHEVVEYGRTSGWSTGKISAIGSYLNLRNDTNSVVPTEFREHPGDIVLAIGILTNRSDKEFIQPGDSGSVVLLNESGVQAAAVGLGFAANEATNMSYMTPMGLVIRDIESITGAKVVQPESTAEAKGANP